MLLRLSRRLTPSLVVPQVACAALAAPSFAAAFQSTAATTAPTGGNAPKNTSNTSNNNNSSNTSNNNNRRVNRDRRGIGRRFSGRSNQPAAGSLAGVPAAPPKLEIYDIRDEPQHGSLTRITYSKRAEDRFTSGVHNVVTMSIYPQLGPRKTDPSDPVPQFDLNRRTSVHLRPAEIAGLVAVIEGHIAEASFGSKTFSLNAQRGADGVKLSGHVVIRGEQAKGATAPTTRQETYAVTIKKTNLLLAHRFLESCLIESFGFKYTGAGDVFRTLGDLRRASKPAQGANNQQQQQPRRIDP